MKKINIWDIKTSYDSSIHKNITYFSHISKLLDFIKKNDIVFFNVIDSNGYDDGKENAEFIRSMNKNALKSEIRINYVDENHVAFCDPDGNLFISKNFFDKNKNVIKDAVINNIFDKNPAYIFKYIYDENLIRNLTLTCDSLIFEDSIELSNNIKQFLKEHKVNVVQKKGNNKSERPSENILGMPYELVISSTDNINIYDDITDLENLKYINDGAVININNALKYKNDDRLLPEEYEKWYDIILALRENGQDNTVVVSLRDRKSFSKSRLYNSDFNVIIEDSNLSTYTLEDLKEEDKLLDLMVNDIKYSSYSQFEKYIAIYNVVKKFKKYKENNKDKRKARKIKDILNNDFMVCVGYVSLLKELLSRVGIESYLYYVKVDMCGHCRLIVNISDAKYDINGFYVSDPTWDNNLTEDYYNHALMSFDKTGMEMKMFDLTSEELIMNSKNLDEFQEKINFLLNRRKKELPANINISDLKIEILIAINLCDDIMNILQSLCHKQYLILKDEYNMLKYLVNKKDKENTLDYNIAKYIYNFIGKCGEFFIQNLGKDVPIKTIINAAASVNQNVFNMSEEQKHEYEKVLLDENIKYDKSFFPYYYEKLKTKN